MSEVQSVDNAGQTAHQRDEFAGNIENSEKLTSFSGNDAQAAGVAGMSLTVASHVCKYVKHSVYHHSRDAS